MLQPLLVLVFLLQQSSGDIVTKLSSHYSGTLKSSCDALPYRTVYRETQSESKCYFVIEADTDSEHTTKQCSNVLAGAKLAGNASNSVYTSFFARKTEFLEEGKSAAGAETKALCVYETRFPCLTGEGLPVAESGTCVRPEEQKIDYRLQTPYRTNFKGKVKPGQIIRVKGISTGARKAFSINLCGDPRPGNWQLHMVVNWEDGMTRLMAYMPGTGFSFKQEYPNSIQQGVAYDVIITVLEDRYKINIDGKTFYEYQHRLPISTITHLLVQYSEDGDYSAVENYVGYVNYIDLGEKDEPFPSANAISFSLPICKKDECDRFACKSLVIGGQFNEGLYWDNQFNINLLFKNGDTALRIYVNFRNAGVVSVNHQVNRVWQLNGNWGVGVGKFPFKKNVPFEVIIKREPTAYQIAVNGEHMYTYPHRLPAYEITRVTTRGIEDVVVKIK